MLARTVVALVGALALGIPALAAPPAPGDTVELLFVGDVAPAGRRVPDRVEDVRGAANPLRGFADRFERADLVVANLEGLLTEEPPKAYAHSRLDIGARPLWAPMFAAAHVGVVATANNHSADGGGEALLESVGHVAKTGVTVIGAGATAEDAEAPYVLERPGGCVAVLPATTKSNRGGVTGAAFAWYPERRYDALVERVKTLSARCAVVVYVHWGREGGDKPIASVERLARRLVDAGADAVVGHHAHVLYGVEVYKGAPIAYGLGNFVFTNRTPVKRLTGVLALELTLDGPGTRVSRATFLPAVISLREHFTPLPAEGSGRADVWERLRHVSKRYDTRLTDDGERFVIGLKP